MNSHGRQIAMDMRAVSKKVSDGEKHMSVLAVVVGLAVMREGSEIVLMLQGLWTTGSQIAMLGGGVLGLIAGVATGALMYAGFLALSMRRVFALTNGFLMLIAAGMAARGANFLSQAGLIPSLRTRMWDTSTVLSDQSPVGQLLAALVGYIARPSGIEVAFYAATVGVIITLLLVAHKHVHHAKHALVIFALALGGSCFMSSQARAESLEVLSPYVTQGEAEFEHQGYVSHDRNSGNSNNQDYIGEFGYSPTSWWRAELEGEFERDPGSDQNLRYGSLNWENTFMLAEPGEYWIDPGFFLEHDWGRAGDPNNIITGFLGAKTIGPVAETFNLLLHKDYGPGATPMGFAYSNQAKYRWKAWMEPGFEVYGDTGGKDKFSDQQFAVGPGVFGKIYTFNAQALKYELVYLFGATNATPDSAVRWKLEYEFSF
jgi:hypothetical protein